MITILPFTNPDLTLLPPLQPEGWLDINPSFQYYVNSPYCSPIKVVENDTIVGLGTTIMHADTVWLAGIIVHAAHRNKGLGRIITQYLVDSVDKQLFKTIYLIATNLGEPVYTKLGFEVEGEQIFYKGETKSFDISPNIIPFEEKYRNGIYALDALAHGENRQKRLDETIEKAKVYVNNGTVEGYYFPELAEGHIVASTTEAGIELMKLRLQTFPNAVIPLNNKAAIDFIKENGFTEFRTAKRMRLGVKRPFHSEMVYNRVNGQIG